MNKKKKDIKKPPEGGYVYKRLNQIFMTERTFLFFLHEREKIKKKTEITRQSLTRQNY